MDLFPAWCINHFEYVNNLKVKKPFWNNFENDNNKKLPLSQFLFVHVPHSVDVKARPSFCV